jgi:hypothetical protein
VDVTGKWKIQRKETCKNNEDRVKELLKHSKPNCDQDVLYRTVPGTVWIDTTLDEEIKCIIETILQ